LQDKLHQNICRRRTLVSVGTHDLDTVQGPFTYDALPPNKIKFTPLNMQSEMDAEQLMIQLDNNLHLKKYLHIIRDSPLYPVIYDRNGVVLSLPPIINGDKSKITLNTKNVFIEVTATDLTKAEVVLNTICAMFSEYCPEKFTIEQVEVTTATGTKKLFPDVTEREVTANVDYITSSIGAAMPADQVATLLTKMSLTAELSADRKQVQAMIPCTRSDILHACDIMEDVAIAYGFNNIPRAIPQTYTVGRQTPINKLSDLLRQEIALAGYTEVLNLALCSRDETFTMLNRVDNGSAVSLANPQTFEFQVARTSLLVGILKTVGHNKKAALPIKIFELSDIVLQTDKTDVGACNQRDICALYCNNSAGFEVIHGLVDRVMEKLGVSWQEKSSAVLEKSYRMVPSSNPTFFSGRCADIVYRGKVIGVFGIVHPKVLAHYGIPFPCSAVELCIESFV